MKSRLLPVLLLFFSNTIVAQRLWQIHALAESPVSGPVAKIWPVGKNQVWITGLMPQLPTLIKGDSSLVFRAGKSGFIPESNPIVGVWKNLQGETWLCHGLLPAYFEPGWPVPNGGIAKVNLNQPFQLFNAAQNVPLIGVQEKQWHSAVYNSAENRLWIGSDTGLRWIVPSTLQTGLIPIQNLPITDILLVGKKFGNWPVFRNRKFEWIKIQQNFVSILWKDIPSKFTLLDMAIQGQSDTLVLLDSLHADPPFGILHRKAGAALFPLHFGDSISHFTIDQSNNIWTLSHRGKLSKHGIDQSFTLDSIKSKTATFLTSDSTGNIWWILDHHKVYRLSSLKAGISGKDTLLICDSTTWQFRDGSTSLNGAISTWQWDFGDGESSTEKDPRHRYKQEGFYTVRLTVSDGTAATSSVSKEVFVTGNLYLGLKTPGPFVSCQAVRLEAYGTNDFFWQKPDGSRDTSFAIMAQQSGVYKVQASNGSCVFRDSVQVSIQSNTLNLEIDLKDPDGNPLAEESPVFLPIQVQASASPADQICRIRWKLDGNLLPDSSSDVSFPVTEEGKHVLEFEGYNPFGCPVYGRKEWSLAAPSFPNLVTLNGDGKNEVFEIPSLRFLSENRLSIFNRWGKEVFNAAPYQNNWPAKEASPGTYFYQLQVAGKNYSGWIEVVIP